MIDNLIAGEPVILVIGLFSMFWWSVILLASCLIIWALESDSVKWASAALISTLLVLVGFSNTPILKSILFHPHWVLVGFLLYVILGAVWGIFKWRDFVLARRNKYEDDKRDWLLSKGITISKEIPDELKEAWYQKLLCCDEWAVYSHGKKIIQLRPLAWQNKDKIITWMTYWPWSFVWWVIDDFVRSIFLRIQRMISNFLESISTYYFKDTVGDYTVSAVKESGKVVCKAVNEK